MKKRVISILIAIVLIFSCTSVTALAAGSNSLSDQLKDYFDNYDPISSLRNVASAVGFKDAYHAVSANGEPVTLSISDLVNDINTILRYAKNYEIKYQWYTYDSLQKNAKAVANATGVSMKTAPFNSTGLQYYFCKICIYQKLGIIKLKTAEYSTPLYVVGYTGLPVIYINTPDSRGITSNKNWMDGATIDIVGGPNEDYDLDTQTIRIKGRGNSSWTSSTKGSYTIKFDSKQDIFGIGKDKTWALIGNFGDKSLLRNWFAAALDQKVFDDGTEWNVTQKHVELVINGDYRGDFTLATTIRLGDNRIDVADISKEIKKDRNKDGIIDYFDAGFVVEVNELQDEKYNFSTSIAHVPFSLSDPDLDDDSGANEAIYQHIKSVVQNAENVLYSKNFADKDSGYASVLDVDSFVDYYLLKELSKDQDGCFNRSLYMYFEPKDGKLHIASSWDFDLAFGNTQNEDANNPEGFRCDRGWYARLFEDPDFAEKVAARWAEIRPTLMQVLKTEIPRQADSISASAKMNFAKWPELGMWTFPASTGWWARWTYQSEVDYLMRWTSKRIAWLDGALSSRAGIS